MYVGALNFSSSPNLSAKALRAFAQHLPPWYDDILSNSINRTHLRTRDPRFSETVRLGYLLKLIAYSILNTGQLTCLHWQLDDCISSHVQGVPKKETAGATLHLQIICSWYPLLVANCWLSRIKRFKTISLKNGPIAFKFSYDFCAWAFC